MADVISFPFLLLKDWFLKKEKAYSTLLEEITYTQKYENLPVFHFSEHIRTDFKKKKLYGLIFGNFGARNYGDESLLAGQLNELKQIKTVTSTVVSRFPDMVKQIHGVKGVSML